MAERSPITNTSRDAICDLTARQAREMFFYCPDEGRLFRRIRSGTTGRKGEMAGSLRKSGYRSVHVNGRLYVEHRLIWLWWYGEWPRVQIDHANGIRDDNRVSNLRLATNAENQRNAGVRRDNRLGVKGVHKAGNRYRALISVNGKQRHLGYYQSIDAAREAYNRASTELHGQFSRLA